MYQASLSFVMKMLYKRRKELGITLRQVANIVGVSEATVQRWESGNIKNLRQDKIAKLATALEISPATLMGWRPEVDAMTSTLMVPVISSISIEENGTLDMNYQGEELAWNLSEANEYYYYIVKGDNMAPYLIEGDLALVRVQSEAENGDLVLAFADCKEGAIYKLQQESGILALASLNPAYQLKIFGKDVAKPLIFGKLISVTRKL